MKVCHTEAMKLIKELEKQKDELIEFEDRNSTVSYKEGETPIDSGYAYEKTREQIRAIDDRIRAVRTALGRANTEVIAEPFGITIGEALVLLAQLQNERAQVESLTGRNPLKSEITYNGVIRFTRCNYDVRQAEADAGALRKRISDLQIAIDRANLTNYIEI